MFSGGIHGVFDLEDLVDLLQGNNAEDIFVVSIPPEVNYVDYIVIVTGKSRKHMLGIAEFVRMVYKRKRFETDMIPHIEGKDSADWMALDLGKSVCMYMNIFCVICLLYQCCRLFISLFINTIILNILR